MKTITEIKQNSARNIFIAKNDYLVLNPLRGWEPVERLQERSDVVLCFFQYEANSTDLNPTKDDAVHYLIFICLFILLHDRNSDFPCLQKTNKSS